MIKHYTDEPYLVPINDYDYTVYKLVFFCPKAGTLLKLWTCKYIKSKIGNHNSKYPFYKLYVDYNENHIIVEFLVPKDGVFEDFDLKKYLMFFKKMIFKKYEDEKNFNDCKKAILNI